MTTKISRALFYSVLILLLLPENLVNPILSGLDPSWQIATELAVKNKLVFGKDFVFTYGPLGFLETKLTIYCSKWLIFFLELGVIAAFVYAIRFYLAKFDTWVSYVILIFFCFAVRGKSESAIHLLFPCFVFHACIFSLHKNILSFWICSVVSVISFFCKINYGLIAMLSFYIISIILIINSDRSLRFKLLWPIIFNVFLLVFFTVFFRVELLGYVRGAYELTNSYSAAMSFKSPIIWNSAFIILLISVTLLPIVGVSMIKGRLKSFETWVALLFAFFYFLLLFKNGYTRADGTHRFEFIYLVAMPFFILTCQSQNKKSLINVSFVFICFISFAFTFHFRKKDVFSFNYLRQLFVNIPLNTIKYDNGYQKYEISPELVAKIGNQSIDIIPWEVSTVFKHNLNYLPRPVFQSYAAYSYYLDSLNAAQIKGKEAATYILYSNETIDNRMPFWDESITKKALAQNYEVISDFEDIYNARIISKKSPLFSYDEFCTHNKLVCNQFERDSIDLKKYLFGNNVAGRTEMLLPTEYNYLLLKRREKPIFPINERVIFSNIFNIDDTFNIPTSNGLLYLYADVKLSVLGKIKKLFCATNSLEVVVEYSDGYSNIFKAVVPILKTGVLINKSVIDNLDAYLFFKYNGKYNREIKSIRFVNNSDFEKTMNIRIVEVMN